MFFLHCSSPQAEIVYRLFARTGMARGHKSARRPGEPHHVEVRLSNARRRIHSLLHSETLVGADEKATLNDCTLVNRSG
jgi:hypothetical protein